MSPAGVEWWRRRRRRGFLVYLIQFVAIYFVVTTIYRLTLDLATDGQSQRLFDVSSMAERGLTGLVVVIVVWVVQEYRFRPHRDPDVPPEVFD